METSVVSLPVARICIPNLSKRISLYGSCGSRNYRRFGRRATDVKTGNAGPKIALAAMGEKGVSGPPVRYGLLST